MENGTQSHSFATRPIGEVIRAAVRGRGGALAALDS
jgi:hypothetical protein